ncbi:MAG: hypothetical protein HUK40_22175 [Desulfobacter sp.]|nr:hypothetical protein [Desulfobacter sp.]WDP86330.1 MAG: hypothetical protein HUN05_15360 [Desulfobacter sp.]
MVQDNDDIIELTEVVGDDSSDEADQNIIELTQIVPGENDLADSASSIPFDPEAQGKTALPSVSQEEFEAALERVIEKKFSKTIEALLFETLEKVIQTEITQIKEGLQKDLDDIGSA